MLVPSKCAGDDDSKDLFFSHMLELRVVKGVIITEGLLLARDCSGFAFRGDKLDVVTRFHSSIFDRVI